MLLLDLTKSFSRQFTFGLSAGAAGPASLVVQAVTLWNATFVFLATRMWTSPPYPHNTEVYLMTKVMEVMASPHWDTMVHIYRRSRK
jgi:hypothetical protein